MTRLRHALGGVILRWAAIVLVKLVSRLDEPPASRIQYIQEDPA